MTYPNIFYARIVFLGFSFFILYAAFTYLQTPEIEFEELGTEFCTEREVITGYCLDTETETTGFEKMDSWIIYFLIGIVVFSIYVNIREVIRLIIKSKTNPREHWDDEFKK